MASLNIALTANDQDAVESMDGTGYSATGNNHSVTSHSSDESVRTAMGMVFQGVNIPRNSIITAATVSIEIDKIAKDTAELAIDLENVDSADDFTATADVATRAGNMTGATPTATWSAANIGAGVTTSPDFADQVQAIIDRAGWVSGNAMCVLLVGSDASTAAEALLVDTFDHATKAAPEIDITWTPPEEGTGTSSFGGTFAATSERKVIGGGSAVNGMELGKTSPYFRFPMYEDIGNKMVVSDHAGLDFTDLDMRARVRRDSDDWSGTSTGTLFHKNASFAWRFYSATTGSMGLHITRGGSTSSDFSPTLNTRVPTNEWVWVRVTHVASTGATAWYWAADDGTFSWDNFANDSMTGGDIDQTADDLNVGELATGSDALSRTSVSDFEFYDAIDGTITERVSAADLTNDADSTFASAVSGETVTISRSGTDDLSWVDGNSGAGTRQIEATSSSGALGSFTGAASGMRTVGASSGIWTPSAIETQALKANIGPGFVIPGTESYGGGTANNYVHTDGVSVTSNLDIRIDFEPDRSWAATAYLVTQYGTSGNRSFNFYSFFGLLGLWWSDDGTAQAGNSGVVHGFADNVRRFIRVTLDVDNGSTQHEVKFWTSSDGGMSWDQLGATQTTAGTTSIHDSSGAADLTIGALAAGGVTAAGTIYRAEVYDGIDGTLVEEFDPGDAPDDVVSSYVASFSGNTHTIERSGSPDLEVLPVATLVYRSGSAAGALGSLTGAATSDRNAVGTGSTALGALTGAADGVVVTEGTAAAALGSLSSVATGTAQSETVSGAAAFGFTGVATGSILDFRIEGTGSATLGSLTGASAGTRNVESSVAVTAIIVTSGGTGERSVGAVGTGTLGAFTAEAGGIAVVNGTVSETFVMTGVAGSTERHVLGIVAQEYGMTLVASSERTLTATGSSTLGSALVATGAHRATATGVGNLGFTGISAGEGVILGVAASNLGGTLAASSLREVYGIATGALGNAASVATGERKVFGSTTTSFGVTLACSNTERNVGGTGSSGFGGSLAAAGANTVTASGTASLGALTLSATGTRPIQSEDATSEFGGTLTATGEHSVEASGSASFGFTGFATGSSDGFISGTGLGTFGGFTGTAIGTHTAAGSGAASFVLTLASTGERNVAGTATAAFGVTLAASGEAEAEATGTSLLGELTATAAGTRNVIGTASSAFGGLLSGSSTEATAEGTGIVTFGPMAAVAVGERSVIGAASASFGGTALAPVTAIPHYVYATGLAAFNGSLVVSDTLRTVYAVAVGGLGFTATAVAANNGWAVESEAGVYNIYAYKRSAVNVTFRLVDRFGNFLITDGFTSTFDIRRRMSSYAAIVELTSAAGDIVFLGDGYVSVSIPGFVTDTLSGDNVYAFNMVTIDGETDRVLQGDFYVADSVTELTFA
jgi:hypothetical protein